MSFRYDIEDSKAFKIVVKNPLEPVAGYSASVYKARTHSLKPVEYTYPAFVSVISRPVAFHWLRTNWHSTIGKNTGASVHTR